MKIYHLLYHFIYFIILFFFPLFTSATENSKTIKILIKKPDEIERNYFDEKLETIKQKYRELAQNYDEIKDIQLEFLYCPDNENRSTYYQHFFLKDEEYRNYLNCVADYIKNSKCDMLIQDDKFILGDDALIENYAINRLFGYKRVRSNFLKLNEYINENDYIFHDKELLDGGSSDNNIYGLPFEIDYDLIYYHKDFEYINHLPNNGSIIWDNLLNINKFQRRKVHHNHKNIQQNEDIHQIKNEQNQNIYEIKNEGQGQSHKNKDTEHDKNNEQDQDIHQNKNVEQDQNIKQNKNEEQDQLNYKGPLSIPLGDEDELLNIFIEYTGYEYGKEFVTNKDVQLINFLKSGKHFENFKEFIKKATGTTNSEEMENLLKFRADKAFDSFIKREYPLYIGKASYYKYISSKTGNNISVIVLPMGVSVFTEKYVIVNNNSQLNKKLLAKVANILSSKAMQYYKNEKLGSLPTFDLPNNDIYYTGDMNKNSTLICPVNQVVCDSLNNVYRISIKNKFFNQTSSSSIMEVRDIIPLALKKYLINGGTEAILSTFKNNIVLSSYSNDYIDVPFIILYGSLIVFVLFSLIIMTMVYQYRNHPYLKMISPRICILAILGLVSTTVSIPFYGHFPSPFICKITFIIGIIIRDLIFLPMFVIIYRIYYIYTNEYKVNFGKKLNDRHLFTLIGIIMFINVSIGLIIVFSSDFYIININCNQRNYFRSEFIGSQLYSYIYFLYYVFIVSYIYIYFCIISIIKILLYLF